MMNVMTKSVSLNLPPNRGRLTSTRRPRLYRPFEKGEVGVALDLVAEAAG